jgi:pimeloyl-ACP methyl ester carboxylesterase
LAQTTKLLALARRRAQHAKPSRARVLRSARGGLNWYRNIDSNWDRTAPWQDAQIRQPSLFIAGAQDSVIIGLIGAKRVAELDRVLPSLKAKVIIDGAGHWIQQQRPEQVNAVLIAFLKENA